MEEYHISKEALCDNSKLNELICNVRDDIDDSEPMDIMNCKINKQEVLSTFGSCIDAPGPDGFHGNLLDKVDRGIMSECLLYL